MLPPTEALFKRLPFARFHEPLTRERIESSFDYWIIDENGKPNLRRLGPGNTFKSAAAPTLRMTLHGTTLTAEISRSDLAYTRRFRFYAWTNSDFGSRYGDDAPGGRNALSFPPRT